MWILDLLLDTVSKGGVRLYHRHQDVRAYGGLDQTVSRIDQFGYKVLFYGEISERMRVLPLSCSEVFGAVHKGDLAEKALH